MYETQNKKVIKRMAKADLKAAKMRNLFVVLTILMASAMLVIMGLFPGSMRLATQRLLENAQHVIYMDLEKKQIEKLKSDDRISYLTLSKIGESIEVEDYRITKAYYDGASTEIRTQEIIEGRAPAEGTEIAVPKAYLQKLGMEPKIGTQIRIPALNGKAETCTVTGFYRFEGTGSNYLILYSKQYAEEGRFLKGVHYNALVQIAGADHMSQDQFEETFAAIGADAGVSREDINPHNTYWGTLPDGLDSSAISILAISALILIAGIMVIYSVFYISISGKTREYGQLRTLGMTKRQVKQLVRKQGMLLALVTAPVGAALGAVIMGLLKPGGFSLTRSLTAMVLVVFVVLLVVLLSVLRPAKIAAAVSPIEAANYTAYQGVQIGKKQKRKAQLHRRLTPFRLAGMNVIRNRKKTFMTVLSLGLSGMLFIGGATYITSLDRDLFSRQGVFRIGEFSLHLSSNAVNQTAHGEAELQLADKTPFTKAAKEQIEAIPDVKKVIPRKSADVWYTYDGREPAQDSVSGFSREEAERLQRSVSEGAFTYDAMLSGDKILIANNQLADEIYGEPFQMGDTVEITYWNGKKEIKRQYEIIGALDGGDFNLEGQYGGWFMVPDRVLAAQNPETELTSEWVVSTISGDQKDPEKAAKIEAQVESQMDQILAQNPLLSMETLREHREADETVLTQMTVLVMGLALFITMFSLMNLVNTLITNFLSQKSEFAMLQSIGMTGKQLRTLVIGEGMYLAVGNIILSLLLGSAAGFALCQFLFSTGAKYMVYQFPTLYALGYGLAVVLVPCMIAAVEIRKFKNQSMVDRLREV